MVTPTLFPFDLSGDVGQHYVCVCVRACFHVVLHVSGISGIQIPSLEHMLASLSLIC